MDKDAFLMDVYYVMMDVRDGEGSVRWGIRELDYLTEQYNEVSRFLDPVEVEQIVGARSELAEILATCAA